MVTVPPDRPRTSPPATVVVAPVLALVGAAGQLVGVANLLSTLGRLSPSRSYSPTSSALAGLVGSAVLLPLVLAVAAVLGSVGVLRDRPRAHVVLTVVAAVLVVLGVVGLAGVLTGPGVVSPLLVVSVALWLAVLVLLRVPASRAWFARPR